MKYFNALTDGRRILVGVLFFMLVVVLIPLSVFSAAVAVDGSKTQKAAGKAWSKITAIPRRVFLKIKNKFSSYLLWIKSKLFGSLFGSKKSSKGGSKKNKKKSGPNESLKADDPSTWTVANARRRMAGMGFNL